MSASEKGGSGGYKTLCPACGSRMRICSLPTDSLTTTTMLGQCTNFFCGACYMGTLQIDAVASPSKLDNPIVQLPSAKELRSAAHARIAGNKKRRRAE